MSADRGRVIHPPDPVAAPPTEFRLATTAQDLVDARAFRAELYAGRYTMDPATWEADIARDKAGYVFLATRGGGIVGTVRFIPAPSRRCELEKLGLLPPADGADWTLAEGGRLAARPAKSSPSTGLMMQVWGATWLRHHTSLRRWIAWSRRDLLPIHARVGAQVLAGPCAVPLLGPGEFFVVGGRFDDVAVRGMAMGCSAVAAAAASTQDGAAVVTSGDPSRRRPRPTPRPNRGDAADPAHSLSRSGDGIERPT